MNKDKPKLERVLEKPIKVFGKQLKVMRVILIFLATSLYAGMMYVELDSIVSLIFTIIFVSAFVLSILLMNKKILYLGKYNLECSAAGDVYLTQLQGICPKCKGLLRISKRNKKKILECQENKTHIWDLQEN